MDKYVNWRKKNEIMNSRSNNPVMCCANGNPYSSFSAVCLPSIAINNFYIASTTVLDNSTAAVNQLLNWYARNHSIWCNDDDDDEVMLWFSIQLDWWVCSALLSTINTGFKMIDLSAVKQWEIKKWTFFLFELILRIIGVEQMRNPLIRITVIKYRSKTRNIIIHIRTLMVPVIQSSEMASQTNEQTTERPYIRMNEWTKVSWVYAACAQVEVNIYMKFPCWLNP